MIIGENLVLLLTFLMPLLENSIIFFLILSVIRAVFYQNKKTKIEAYKVEMRLSYL